MSRHYPYRTIVDPLPLVAETQILDGQVPPVDLLAARRSIDLSRLPAGWHRASLRLRFDLPQQLIGEGVTDVDVTLSLDCASTNLRFGDLEIEAGALAHRAVLRAVVAATIDGVPKRYYGESESWNVWVSAPEVPLLTGDLDVKWADFTGEKRPAAIDPAFKDHAHYIDVTAEPPVIWLNEGLRDLRRLFDSAPRRSRAETALRDAHFHSIATSGWLAMFNASLGAIQADGDGTVMWPANEWQHQVLLTLLPRIYPDLSTDDSLQRAREDDADAAGSRLLQARALAAVNGLLREAPKIRAAIRALEDA
jgi:hypothetical protein